MRFWPMASCVVLHVFYGFCFLFNLVCVEGIWPVMADMACFVAASSYCYSLDRRGRDRGAIANRKPCTITSMHMRKSSSNTNGGLLKGECMSKAHMQGDILCCIEHYTFSHSFDELLGLLSSKLELQKMFFRNRILLVERLIKSQWSRFTKAVHFVCAVAQELSKCKCIHMQSAALVQLNLQSAQSICLFWALVHFFFSHF